LSTSNNQGKFVNGQTEESLLQLMLAKKAQFQAAKGSKKILRDQLSKVQANGKGPSDSSSTVNGGSA
jgi:hypothetical protein